VPQFRVLSTVPLRLKKETAEHVRKIIKELKFIPNSFCNHLEIWRSNTYGLIVPDLTNPFFPEFLLDFEEVLVENDHEILVATTQSSEEKLTNSVVESIGILMVSDGVKIGHACPIDAIDCHRRGDQFDRNSSVSLHRLGVATKSHGRSPPVLLRNQQKILERHGFVRSGTTGRKYCFGHISRWLQKDRYELQFLMIFLRVPRFPFSPQRNR